MGCRVSKGEGEEEEEERVQEIGDFVSPKEVELIRHTWDVVRRDVAGTGIYMFTRLFELQSDFRKMFKRMMTQSETGDYDIDWSKLGSHASTVMAALDNAVRGIGDSSFLSTRLQDLGQRHRLYNVKPEMVALMWPAVRDALKHALGEQFTTETELAWKHIFDYIAYHMARGMRRTDKAGPNTRPSSKSAPSPPSSPLSLSADGTRSSAPVFFPANGVPSST